MHRKIKTLGLALVAALALTAVMASAAQAQFTSSASHTLLSGSQTTAHKFTAGAGVGAITCTTASFSGTSVGTESATQVITPTYAGCKDSLGRTVDIPTNTLSYTFTVTGHDGEGTPTGVTHTSGEIVLTVTGSTHCTITIKGPQTNNGITYHNKSGSVETTTNTTNVSSTISGGFFACGTSATSSNSGTYTGSTLMSGSTEGGGAASISVD